MLNPSGRHEHLQVPPLQVRIVGLSGMRGAKKRKCHEVSVLNHLTLTQTVNEQNDAHVPKI